MTQQEKEKMFLDLNSVLVKFWKEQGRPDKEVKIELLERMLNWYKKMGYVTLDKQSKEPVTESLEEAVEQQIEDFAGCVPSDDCKVHSTYLDRISWIKEKFRYFYNLGKRNVEYLYSKLPGELDEAARAYTCGSISDEAAFEVAAFKAGAEWQKEQMGEQARKELAKTDITLADLVAFDEGFKLGRRLERQDMLKEAVKGTVCKDKKCVWIELIPNALPDYEDIEPVKCVVMKED